MIEMLSEDYPPSQVHFFFYRRRKQEARKPITNSEVFQAGGDSSPYSSLVDFFLNESHKNLETRTKHFFLQNLFYIFHSMNYLEPGFRVLLVTSILKKLY